jgi:hypothetical protein
MLIDKGAPDMVRAFILAESKMIGNEDMRIANGSPGEA